MKRLIPGLFVIGAICPLVFACQSGAAKYRWERIADRAGYPEGYNYPVFVFGDWMVALNNGAWLSNDGEKWVKTDLPETGLNSAYQKYVQFGGAIYALGTMTGNYERMLLTSKISRTRDFLKWETVAESSNLPARVFYGMAVFRGKMWLAGGYDGQRYYNDVWNSEDGVNWQKVTEKSAWSPRNTRLVVFRDQLWLLGGAVIDGHRNPNPDSGNETWTSRDGVNWAEVKVNQTGKTGGTPIVFDNKLWLIGGNRNDGNFGSAYSVSDDGINWRSHSAPWSPRGAAVVWEYAGKLYMTGGKFSETVNGQIRFIYSNDVWAMSAQGGKEL